MPKRAWSEQAGPWVILYGLILLVILAGMVFAARLYVQESVYNEYATSKAHADAAEKFDKECSGLATPKEISGCFYDVIKAARETQRAEEDLDAQKQMGQWAFWSLVSATFIGSISLAVTSVGIVFIRESLNAARKSNEIAREMGEAQVRAYLAVEEAGYTIHASNCQVTCKFELNNTGQSPAKWVYITGQLQYGEVQEGKAVSQWVAESDESSGSEDLISAGGEGDIILHWNIRH